MSDNRRKHPRFEIVAQVQLGADGDISIYPAANLSMGGVFVTVKLAEVPQLKVGTIVDVTVSGMALDGDAPPDHELTTKARVVRLDPHAPGLALEFQPLSSRALAALRGLIDAAQKR